MNKKIDNVGESSENSDEAEDTYQLFTKDLLPEQGKSRNASAVKNYTDDKTILADKTFHDSFDEHYNKYKLGQKEDDSNNLDQIIQKIDSRKGSVVNKFGNFSQVSQAASAFLMRKKTTKMGRQGTLGNDQDGTDSDEREQDQKNFYNSVLVAHLRLEAKKRLDAEVSEEYTTNFIPKSIA